MWRAAFSLIELIFVIVIISILAVVAIPKVAELQDDAKASKEKYTIGAARESVASLYNYKITHPQVSEQNITLTHIDSSTYSCTLLYSPNSYPLGVSVGSTSGTTDNNNTSPTTKGDCKALAPLYLDPNIIVDWNSSGLQNGFERLTGPASNEVVSPQVAIHTGMYWEYSNSNGLFTLKGN